MIFRFLTIKNGSLQNDKMHEENELDWTTFLDFGWNILDNPTQTSCIVVLWAWCSWPRKVQ